MFSLNTNHILFRMLQSHSSFSFFMNGVIKHVFFNTKHIHVNMSLCQNYVNEFGTEYIFLFFFYVSLPYMDNDVPIST